METPHDARWIEYDDETRPANVVERYHVPRSQVWEGSRGRSSGRVHLHYLGDSRPLCSKRVPWYPRDPLPGEKRCSRCVARAEREGIAWPLSERGQDVDGTDGATAPVRQHGTAVPTSEVPRSESEEGCA